VAGCGGIIRGSHGEWLGGFAKCVGLCSAFVAELWGVYEGLRYAHRLGFRRVELHIDSETVVRVVEKRSTMSSAGSSLLKQIWNLLELDWVVEISHTYREANKCADTLANYGCSLGYEVVFFDECPLEAKDMYQYDLLTNFFKMNKWKYDYEGSNPDPYILLLHAMTLPIELCSQRYNLYYLFVRIHKPLQIK
jgi:ribonuclease HI